MDHTGFHGGAGFPLFFGGFAILALLLTVVHIVALVQCVTSKFREPNDKIVWILVLLFVPLIGTILWFTVGKPKTIA